MNDPITDLSSTSGVPEGASSRETEVVRKRSVAGPRWGWFGAGWILALATAILGQVWGWPREAGWMAGILVLAAVWWMTEAIPLYVTSLWILALQILLLANPGGWPGLGFESNAGPPMSAWVASAADSILLLFFGGLVLARACVLEGVDRVLSALLLRPFGTRPDRVLLGVLLVTAFLSMWMSNTATAALVMTLVGPVAARLAPKDAFRTALFLAVPVGANLGGMGTPIASPPNAIAVKYLADHGTVLGFGSWMLVSVPLMLALISVAWVCLRRWYPCQAIQVELLQEKPRLTPRGRWVLITFGITVALWLSEPWHGLPAAYVGLLPALLLTVAGIVRKEDVQSLDWSVLILISGGIALGSGLQRTGLDRLIVGVLPLGAGTGPTVLLVVFTALAVGLAIFMSNTAAANLIIPVAMASATTLSGSGVGGDLPAALALAIALAVGSAMLLPSSTPPNAIAYASGEFSTRDLMRVGAVLSVLTLLLVTLVLQPLVTWVTR